MPNVPPQIPRVFISYSHDSEAHARRVLDLADQLRRDGCIVLFDQFETPVPNVGWTRWMEQCLDPKNSDFVLMVCTETYANRVQGVPEGAPGLGVQWEGGIIYKSIYRNQGQAKRYISILFYDSDRRFIPLPLSDYACYPLPAFGIQDPGYERLYRHITGQPPTPPEELGEKAQIIVLPPVPRAPGVSRGPTAPTGRAGPSPSTVLTARSLQFRLRPSDTAASGFNVELTVPGLDRAEAAFECDPWTEKQTREALDKIEKGECLRDDLAYVGSQLWSGMVHSGVLGQVDQTRKTDPTGFYHVRLRLPRRFDDLPWEALYDRREGFLGTSERFCVIRDLPEDLPVPPPRAGAGRPVGVLVVMPQGSGLDLATEKARIQQRAAVQERAVRVEVLENAVTPDSLRAALGRGGWDVVHFAGHAKTNDKSEVLIRLNGADDPEADHWMEAEVFASLFNASGVGLVVFNCCRAATPYAKRSLSGLGPFLLRKGVPAVIAMRYDLPDPTALRFADEFYRVLFAGPEPGRIDIAIEKARVVIYQNQTDRTVRDFVTPVLFLAVGHERVFVLDPPAPPVVPPGGVAPARPAVEVPEDLLAALLEAKCVPVLGPGVLSAVALRDEAPPPGPRDLARRLAQESNYRAGTLFDLAAGAGPWIDAMLLQWVCQHFSVQRRIGFKMFNIIQQMFRTLKPSSLVRAVATWNTPGFICTYFDGLLQQALQDGSRPVQVINALGANVNPDPGAILLVHLRGHWSDPGSLVLTEDQHNELLDCLVQLPTRVTGLVRGNVGRSLLFLGVDPRDPLVRRLVAKLIPAEHRMTVGPVYFACADPTDDDDAYWQEFNTVWLPAPLADLIAAFTAAVAAGASR